MRSLLGKASQALAGVMNISPVPYASRRAGLFQSADMSMDAERAYAAYGSVGTLFAIVSQIMNAVASTDWHLYRIDCTDIAAVRFYIDGVHVATGTTFAYAAIGADAILQPYVAAYKASGTGVGTVQADNVRIWSNRS